jgi:hypothetical protein
MRRAASFALAALFASLAWGQPAAPKADGPVTFKDPLVDVIHALKTPATLPGECASYANGTANAVLCLQKATTTAANTVLVSVRDGGGSGRSGRPIGQGPEGVLWAWGPAHTHPHTP